jgi:aryl-alcohol dehydrogenase-like predicted oxidoreductase
MDQPRFTCVPIFGARTVDQLEENVGAVSVDLSGEQFDRIADAYPQDSRPMRT